MLKVEKLNWDSDFFELTVGKAELTKGAANDDFENLNEFDLVYFFVDPSDKFTNDKLINRKALLVDEKITYLKDISGEYKKNEHIVSYQRTNQLVDEEIVRIGLQSGVYSRFNIDPNIKKSDFERLYSTWLNKSIDREISKEVLAFIDEDKVHGVITIGEKNSRADIGILAVDENSRGREVGKKLIEATEAYCVSHSYKQLQVVTQKANGLACKFYEKCGFFVESVINIYHLWKPKN